MSRQHNYPPIFPRHAKLYEKVEELIRQIN